MFERAPLVPSHPRWPTVAILRFSRLRLRLDLPPTQAQMPRITKNKKKSSEMAPPSGKVLAFGKLMEVKVCPPTDP
jgi:hypothetical protein